MLTMHTYKSFSMSSSSDYSLGNLRMKTKDTVKAHISKYELRELLTYHKRSLSYSEFSDLRKKMIGIEFSEIIDNLEELQERLEADKFDVSKNCGYRFVHIWFKRTDTGYGSSYKFTSARWYKYMFSFNKKGELIKVDYNID